MPVTSGNDRAHEVERLLTDPFDRLMAVLERGEEQIEERRAELAEVRYALYELTAQGGMARPAQAGHVLEPLRAEMAAPLLRYLIEHTTDLSRVCTMVIDAGAGIEQENYRLNQDLLAEGRFRQHTIYPMDIMDTEPGRAWVRSFAAAGEEQRLSLSPPSEFAIFDEHSMVAVSEWGNPESSYVMVRDPMLIAAFIQLFDRAFERALPVATGQVDGVGHDEGQDDDQRLLKLLGLGLKDESIARYLGCSLRTVRRRVAGLMTRHGVQTRFQLGLAASASGLGSPVSDRDR
jgi:DNA-binding CsgD family transcriptional regulator